MLPADSWPLRSNQSGLAQRRPFASRVVNGDRRLATAAAQLAISGRVRAVMSGLRPSALRAMRPPFLVTVRVQSPMALELQQHWNPSAGPQWVPSARQRPLGMTAE